MNLDRLNELIKNPNLGNEIDLSSLNDLTKKYPYAQLFPLLYLKALHNSKNIRFEEELNKHAYKISDRKKLHDLIYNYTIQTSLNTQDGPSETLKPVENPQVEIILEDISLEVKLDNQFKEIEFADNKVENSTIQELAPKIPNEKESDKIESDKKEIENLEKEFLANIIASSYVIEDTKEIRPVEKIDLNVKKPFSSWLNASNANAKEEQKKQTLIDDFIHREKSPTKQIQEEIPKKEFYSAAKKAKESINENSLIYSETLANIYVMQGNFPKAILAFENLMLTIPEKKLYFAEKIKELNKKINS